jgi:hypothetical protein
VSISNVIASRTGRVGCSITGLPGSDVENVTLANISVEFEGEGKKELVEKQVPERPEVYPESRMFGELPAYGLYCRHVRGLTLSNVRLSTLAPDARHAVVCDDVQDLALDQLSVPPTTDGGAAVVRLTQVERANVRGFKARGPVNVFLKVSGGDNRDLALLGNDFTFVRQVVEASADSAAIAVRRSGNIPAP